MNQAKVQIKGLQTFVAVMLSILVGAILIHVGVIRQIPESAMWTVVVKKRFIPLKCTLFHVGRKF